MTGVEYYIWLSLGMNAANHRTDIVLAAYDDPADFYKELRYGDMPRVPVTEPERARLRAMSLDHCLHIKDECERLGIAILSYHDPRYPQRLREITAAPAVLYLRGTLPLVEECVTLGIVGTRRCTEYGKRATLWLAGELARAGMLVVSGLADGVDSHAHRAALDAGGRTLAVVGGGLDIDYPPRNHGLKQEIAANTAVISEYPPGTKHLGMHFPQRNRIIAGLANGVLVTEAPRRSGALITAHHAVEQGKEVFVVPGSIFSTMSEGCMALLKEGAYPVDSAFDIIDFYRGRTGAAFAGAEGFSAAGQTLAALPREASDLAARVYGCLGDLPKTLDDISLSCGSLAKDVLAAMTELELYGCIVSHSGQRYSR